MLSQQYSKTNNNIGEKSVHYKNKKRVFPDSKNVLRSDSIIVLFNNKSLGLILNPFLSDLPL